MLAIGSDHGGFALKKEIMQHLDEKGVAYKDFGTYSADSCDYPDFAHPMAAAMEAGDIYPGIAVCGTGNGIGMTLNKHQSIRAAICWENEICRLARAHNDANILVLPGRFVSNEVASQMLDTFLNTPFEGGRHKRRIDKIPVK